MKSMASRVAALGILLFLVFTSVRAQAPQYDQQYRPQVHFSPQHNWTNDPNGLVYFDGEYHLFFQYNPSGDQWGHMSWGHAVSTDLLHWKELPVAIAEDKDGMIFTGSVVVDRENTSGFCKQGHACLVAVYTVHAQIAGGVRQTQNIAYSVDRGRTWTRYAKNPVLDLQMADFRDPSVSWNEATKRWVMAVSLPKEHKVRFYGSKDLKDWSLLSDFGPAGDVAGDWECPDLLAIPGDSGKGSTWALKVGLNPGAPQGGSGEQYFLGDFDGTRFTAAETAGAHGWTNYGKDDYCAISFNGLPKTDKPVLLGWMSNWEYASKLPTSPWRGQMSLPRRLSFIKDSAGLALKQEPVTAALRGKSFAIAASKTSGESAKVPYEAMFHFTATKSDEFGVRLYSDDEHWTDVGFDLKKHVFYIDRTKSGLEIGPGFMKRTEAPLVPGRPYDLHLVVDRSSVEAFAQEGTIAMTDLIFPQAPQSKIVIFPEGSEKVGGTGWELHSIWDAELNHK